MAFAGQSRGAFGVKSGNCRSAPYAVADAEEERLQFSLLWLTVLLLPLNWLLGTSFFWMFAIAFILAVSLKRFSPIEYLLCFLMLALAFSLMVSVLTDYQASRVMAALYNLGVQGIILVFLHWGRRALMTDGDANVLPADAIYRAALYAFVIQAAVIVLAWAYMTSSGGRTLEFPALLLWFGGSLPGILKEYAVNSVVAVDWVSGGPGVRLHGLGAFATEGAFLLMITGLLALPGLYRRNRLLALLAVEVSILPILLMMGSRTTALAYSFSLLFLIVLWRKAVLGFILVTLPVLLFGVLFVVAGPGMELIGAGIQSLMDARAGSTADRMTSYQIAIDRVLDTNVLIGIGVKPEDSTKLQIPIGSHSSIVSMFTKGGLIALMFLAMIYVVVILRVLRTQLLLLSGATSQRSGARYEAATLCRCAFAILVWWVTEDLDGPVYQAALCGLALGLFWQASANIFPDSDPVQPAAATGLRRA